MMRERPLPGWRPAAQSGRFSFVMRSILPCWSVLLSVLIGPVAMAREGEPFVRNLYLSDDPRDEAPRVNVGDGRVATVLRFAQKVDPARTKMLGWEGWFEPLLVGGKLVVLMPLQKIPPEDRFLLMVTLADGTELPFTVTARESGWVDQQINVFPDRESPANAGKSGGSKAMGQTLTLRC
jgi:hypothetical protein